MDTITTVSPSQDGPVIRQANGWLIVLWHGDHRNGTWAYEHHDRLNDAVDEYERCQSGEYRDFSPAALLACKDGIPFARLSAWRVSDLMRETRAA